MNDDEISQLDDAIKNNECIYFIGHEMFSRCKRVMRIRELYQDGTYDDEIEPVVVLDTGGFAALYNCDPGDFVRIERVIN